MVLLCLLPWIARQPLGASYWAFSFGVTALACDAMVFVVRGQTSIEWLSAVLFVLANEAMAVIVTGTLWRLKQGTLAAISRVVPPPNRTEEVHARLRCAAATPSDGTLLFDLTCGVMLTVAVSGACGLRARWYH